MAAKPNLMNVIQQAWPGSKCVVRGDEILLWEGPGPKPTASQLTVAQRDYVAVNLEEAALEALATFVEQRVRGRVPTAQEKAAALADLKAAHAAAKEPKK